MPSIEDISRILMLLKILRAIQICENNNISSYSCDYLMIWLKHRRLIEL